MSTRDIAAQVIADASLGEELAAVIVRAMEDGGFALVDIEDPDPRFVERSTYEDVLVALFRVVHAPDVSSAAAAMERARLVLADLTDAEEIAEIEARMLADLTESP